MTKLYPPGQITRRNKEVECQLSQNMADPDRPKRMDGWYDKVHVFCNRYHSRSIAQEIDNFDIVTSVAFV